MDFLDVLVSYGNWCVVSDLKRYAEGCFSGRVLIFSDESEMQEFLSDKMGEGKEYYVFGGDSL